MEAQRGLFRVSGSCSVTVCTGTFHGPCIVDGDRQCAVVAQGKFSAPFTIEGTLPDAATIRGLSDSVAGNLAVPWSTPSMIATAARLWASDIVTMKSSAASSVGTP